MVALPGSSNEGKETGKYYKMLQNNSIKEQNLMAQCDDDEIRRSPATNANESRAEIKEFHFVVYFTTFSDVNHFYHACNIVDFIRILVEE